MEQWAVPKQNLYLTLYSQIHALWDNLPLNKWLDNIMSKQYIRWIMSGWGRRESQKESQSKNNAQRTVCSTYLRTIVALVITWLSKRGLDKGCCPSLPRFLATAALPLGDKKKGGRRGSGGHWERETLLYPKCLLAHKQFFLTAIYVTSNVVEQVNSML